MEQRTCNIIMACKGHCRLPGWEKADSLESVAIYMSQECACPLDRYTDSLIRSIMKEALFDFFRTADNPSFELRTLLGDHAIGEEPTLSQRIATMFSLTKVKENSKYVNGFTEELVAQSRIDLGEADGERGDSGGDE